MAFEALVSRLGQPLLCAVTSCVGELQACARCGNLMREHPPTLPSDHDDALLERLRELARQRDGVPEDVLAAARSVFAAARDDHAGEGSGSVG